MAAKQYRYKGKTYNEVKLAFDHMNADACDKGAFRALMMASALI